MSAWLVEVFCGSLYYLCLPCSIPLRVSHILFSAHELGGKRQGILWFAFASGRLSCTADAMYSMKHIGESKHRLI